MSLLVVLLLVLVVWVVVAGFGLALVASAKRADEEARRQYRRLGTANTPDVRSEETRVREITPFGGRQESPP